MTDTADRIALQDVLLNYTKAVDERDDDLYCSLFTEDCLIVGMGATDINGIDAWYKAWKIALSNYGTTQHMLGPMLATVNGDTATTRSDLQALHYLADEPEKTFTLWATYLTDMVRRDGQWKISRHELVVRGSRVQ